MKTKIEWADRVWNPVTGCTKISAGCAHCYAEQFARRFWGERKFTDVQCHPERLEQPMHWKKPSRIFVNSMSDLFHPDVPDKFIWKVFEIARWYPRHTYIILTKRSKRMSRVLGKSEWWNLHPIIDNIWLGVSVEDQKTADERIPWLLQTKAAVRFVSYEPALGGISFRKKYEGYTTDYLTGWMTTAAEPFLGRKIDWVICGGESGPHARPMHPDWARSVRDQCIDASVPFFFKQMMIDGKLVHMPELDGKIWDQYPRAIDRWTRKTSSAG